MKGRRHRLQYKRKVQPDLVVDFKPTPRQRRIAEAKAQRAAIQAEYWSRSRTMNEENDDDPMYWDERRRFENEMEYNMGWSRGFPGPRPPHMRGPPPPFFGNMMPARRIESYDDRHVVAKHAEIYPKEEELQTIQRIVSHTERALKYVSDALTEKTAATPATANGTPAEGTVSTENSEEKKEEQAGGESKPKEDGRDNQMFSFHKEAEGGSVRLLKGVMRVGLLAKGMCHRIEPQCRPAHPLSSHIFRLTSAG